MNVFIIMYNRLTWPREMCKWLEDNGCEPILVDNNSTYPPLLEWYEECPYKVHRMGKNWGHTVVWKSGLIDDYKDKLYCVTDHDLYLGDIPSDFVSILSKGLELFPNLYKAGFSLELNDLPKNNFTKNIIEWESKFWDGPSRGIYVQASIDTTFAMYDKERDFGLLPPDGSRFYWGVRTNRPYTVKHLPWYNTKEFLEENEEERYYQAHTHTYWSEKFKELI